MIEHAYQISSIQESPQKTGPNAEEQLRNILNDSKQHFLNSHCRSLLGLIEDQMFREAQQVADILNQQQVALVDGTPYHQIRQSATLSLQLQKIRQNAPPYQNFTVTKKKRFMKDLASKYNTSLALHRQIRDEYVSIDGGESTLEISQISMMSERKLRKKIGKVNYRSHKTKYDDSSKEIQELEERELQPKKVKRVCFASQSAKKYFCKELPPSDIFSQRVYLFPTLP